MAFNYEEEFKYPVECPSCGDIWDACDVEIQMKALEAIKNDKWPSHPDDITGYCNPCTHGLTKDD